MPGAHISSREWDSDDHSHGLVNLGTNSGGQSLLTPLNGISSFSATFSVMFKEEFRKRVSGAIGATTTTPVESSGDSGISKKQEPLREDSGTEKPSSSEKRVDERSQEATAPVISKGAVVVPSVVEDEAAAAANKDADADPKPEEEAAAVEEGKNW